MARTPPPPPDDADRPRERRGRGHRDDSGSYGELRSSARPRRSTAAGSARLDPARERAEGPRVELDPDVDAWQPQDPAPIRGRGVQRAPTGRFETLTFEPEPRDDAWGDEELPVGPRTQILRDASRSVISTNDSPDVPFELSLNPYRGCEHGCTYCYARPTHEYLGLSAGLDFETKILVKPDAPALLREYLARPRYRPQLIAFSGVTDPYQPIERRLRLTRGCLEVLADARNPVGIITKSAGITRDLDVLSELARHRAVAVTISVTTLDDALARAMEPRAAQPGARLRAIGALARAGVPVGVNVAPIIPGLTDAESPAILAAARDAGATWAGHIVLRLPHGLRDLFSAWLADALPERRERVLARIRDVREGELSDPRFSTRMRGTGLLADQIHRLFDVAAGRLGLLGRGPELSSAAFRRPVAGQLRLL